MQTVTNPTVSLHTLIRQGEADPAGSTDLRKAVAAAYWAGQERMRGEIVRRLRDRRRGIELGRYRHEQIRAMDALLADPLLGGQGRDDSAEILAWEFAAA